MLRFLRRSSIFWVALGGVFCIAFVLAAQQISPDLYTGLEWRNLGPYHGGRIASVTGVIGQPAVFYAGMPQGGIWKTTSAGVTWFPVFDQVTEIDSIGAIQVAPSDSNVIYAGSGDSVASSATTGTGGDGMYKSTDAGQTWQHIGLTDTDKINKIVVDPHDPNLVLASTTGDRTHPGGGVYRSTDGGQTWNNVLKPEGFDGTRDLEYAYDHPNVIFAATQGTGGGGFGGGGGRGGRAGGPPPLPAKLFKSTDEGLTWTEIASLPNFTGRIGVAIAMNTNAQRIYVVGNPVEGHPGSGLYRSDDQGATWRQMDAGDSRISNGQGAYSCGVWVDSQNPDILYTVSTALYRSTDGGNTFIAFKGAPGGEDYHDMWIDPNDGHRMMVGADQGASVTLDNGRTWSTWYNQPISQVYHVSTDTQYPFWVLAAQQDTGAVMMRAAGDFGQINEFDWLPVPSSEFGTITPDPLNPNIVWGVGYGAGGGGSGMIKIDMKTGQWENIAPNFGADAANYRASRDMWKRFDPFDQHSMYVGYQCLIVTRDSGLTWKAFSPDLTTTKGNPMVPCGQPAPAGRGAAAGGFAGGGRGGGAAPSINDFSISTVKKGVFWSVSSQTKDSFYGDPQIYKTTDDGLHWDNVSNIADLPANGTLDSIETSHQDINTAYVVGRVGGGRGAPGGGAAVDTNVPLIWRTTDGGQSWTKIVDGLPSDQPSGSWVNVVRADPVQKGLIFTGTETTVYVSFDNGDHWQSLRQNLPTTSIRDMVFHTDDWMNDLVIGTYGRGFWVMDDMSPLRELAARAQAIAAQPAYLFKPGDAIRSRINVNWDQPTNLEVPHAPNPPYGAIIYYHLSQPPTGPIALKIYDASGYPVRTISSLEPPPVEGAAYPDYWLMPPQQRALPTAAGTHRINWDLQYDDPPAFNHDLENQMNMVDHSVTPGPHGPQVPPGTYTLKLTVDGHTYTQTVTVHNDPRVGEGPAVMADLRAQDRLDRMVLEAMKDTYSDNDQVAAVRAQVATLLAGQPPADVATAAHALDTKLEAYGGPQPGGRGRGGFGGGGRGGRGGAEPGGVVSFITLNNDFNTMISVMQVGLDTLPPTRAQLDTWTHDCTDMNHTVAAWNAMQTGDLATFNGLLGKNNLQPLTLAGIKSGDPVCAAPGTASTAAPAKQ